jgi:putative tricarboxylic transport membrane protein
VIPTKPFLDAGARRPAEEVGPDVVEVVEVAPEEEPEPAGPVTRLVAAGIVFVVGVAALVGAYRLGLGTPTDPGAGLWPAGASAVLAGVALVLLVRFRRVDDAERFGHGTLTVGFGAASLGGFVVLFGGAGNWAGVGFELAVVALLVFWLKVIGRESWRTTTVVTVVCTVALHLLLIELLGAPIPHVIGR